MSAPAGTPVVRQTEVAVPDFEPPEDAPVPGWADEVEAWSPDGPDSWQRGHYREFDYFDLCSLQYANRDGSVEYADTGVPVLSFTGPDIVPATVADLLGTVRRVARDLSVVEDLLSAEVVADLSGSDQPPLVFHRVSGLAANLVEGTPAHTLCGQVWRGGSVHLPGGPSSRGRRSVLCRTCNRAAGVGR